MAEEGGTKKRDQGRMVHQVSGNSVRRNDVDGAADGAVAPVGGEDHDRRDSGLQRSVKIREALQWQKKYIRARNVKHCSGRKKTREVHEIKL